MGWFRVTVLALSVAFAAPTPADELPARTARIAYVEGPVSVQRMGDTEWDAAVVNAPLTSGYTVMTEPGSRAEVRVSGTAIRLGEGTEIDIPRLDDDALEVTITNGSASVRLRNRARAERCRLGTPQAVFAIDADGSYRVDYDPAREESRLTVVSGSARMEGPSENVIVPAGRSLVLGASADPSYSLEDAPADDDLDAWAQSRDAGWSDGVAKRYVSPYMTGAEDLDANGQWSVDPDYGPLWTPSNVDASWSPYSDGRWVDVQPWGWTWVDNAPWGYAPFHYGRWVQVRNRWAWCPGRRVDRPVYAPAVVGWTGSPSSGVMIAGPSAAGWYPLAPWERLQPWYRATPSHLDRVNAVVRDRPPRDWKGSSDAWRNWNRDHASRTGNRDSFAGRRIIPPSGASTPASTTAPSADALRHTRESSQPRQHPPREKPQAQKAPPPARPQAPAQQPPPKAPPAQPRPVEHDKDKER